MPTPMTVRSAPRPSTYRALASRCGWVVSASPIMVDGQMVGLEVHPARNAREFTAAGLEPGDVVISVEGMPVSEITDYREILQELGNASSVALSLERDGQPLSLSISLD